MKKSLLTNQTLPSQSFYDSTGLAYEAAFGHDPGLHRIMARLLSLVPRRASPSPSPSPSTSTAHASSAPETAPPPPPRLLDCGCGTGRPVSHLASAAGLAVVGIDWSETMVRTSRAQVRDGVFVRTDMLAFEPGRQGFAAARSGTLEEEEKEEGGEEGHFEAVVAMLSLFELERAQIESMLGRFARWLVPGGVLLLGVFGAEDCGGLEGGMFEEERGEGEREGKDKTIKVYAKGIPFTFMHHTVWMNLFTKTGWNALVERQQGMKIVHTETDWFKPPADSGCDDEPHYFLIARKEI